MSNKIFPTFQGWSWNKSITVNWNTTVYTASSGKETRRPNWKFPTYSIELTYNIMTDESNEDISLDANDVGILKGFYNSVGGRSEDFLYSDDVENSVTKQSFGEGDGQTAAFQLIRSVGDNNFAEIVRGIVETPKIYIDDVETTNFTFDNYGVITFNSAPGTAEKPVKLSWTGQYYFRCRFEDDTLQITRSWDGIYENVSVKMVTVK